MRRRLARLLRARERAAADGGLERRRANGSRVLLLLLFTLAVVLLLPAVRTRVTPAFHAGEIADREITAPHTFRVPLSGDELRVARARAALSVPPVFQRRRDVERDLASNLTTLLDTVSAAVYARRLDGDARAERAAQWLPGISREDLRVALDPAGFAPLRAEIRECQRELFARGVVDNSSVLRRNDFREIIVADAGGEQRRSAAAVVDHGRLDEVIRAESRARFSGEPARARLFFELVRGHVLPNLAFDVDETNRRREAVAASVREYFEVAGGERVVGHNERVTREQEAVLRALEEARRSRAPDHSPRAILGAFAAQALRVGLLCLLFGVYLSVFNRDVYASLARLAAVFAVLLVYLAVVAVIVRFGWSAYLAPVAFASVMLAALFDFRLGLATSAFAAALLPLATPIGVGPAFVAWVAGTAGVAGIERMRARSRGYSVFLFVAGAYALGAIAVEGGTPAGWSAFPLQVLWGAVNGLFTAVATVFLLPVFEQVFNRTSRFTLLELTDLNKPILKRLNMEAQGTYHHSMLLGNLVDAIATEIGADALRARVMAYYHDIGKIFKPEYFAENQEPGFNKHEKITAQMSALILVSHVKDGVELARQEKLPEVIIEGIREHHGTTVMAYFYQKALETDSHASVNRDDFRYPGPRPRTREAGVLMCADTVEAAVRSLKDPTPAQIRAMVSRLVDARAAEGELDDSGITLHDLGVVRERLISMLTTVYHRRVAYPGQDAPPADDDRTARESLAESG
jgi:putative nucleotidyltransferase with HDIG domain